MNKKNKENEDDYIYSEYGYKRTLCELWEDEWFDQYYKLQNEYKKRILKMLQIFKLDKYVFSPYSGRVGRIMIVDDPLSAFDIGLRFCPLKDKYSKDVFKSKGCERIKEDECIYNYSPYNQEKVIAEHQKNLDKQHTDDED